MATEKTSPTDRTTGSTTGTNGTDTGTGTNGTDTARGSRLAGLAAGIRDDLRARRAERAERRRLEAELATYRTEAERDDLMAMLDRYDDAEVREIRRILVRNRVA